MFVLHHNFAPLDLTFDKTSNDTNQGCQIETKSFFFILSKRIFFAQIKSKRLETELKSFFFFNTI
jgi:hypothetical protein